MFVAYRRRGLDRQKALLWQRYGNALLRFFLYGNASLWFTYFTFVDGTGGGSWRVRLSHIHASDVVSLARVIIMEKWRPATLIYFILCTYRH